MNDTPETSEAWNAVSRTPCGMYDSRVPINDFAFAMVDHSRKMERERNEANAKIAEIRQVYDARIAELEEYAKYAELRGGDT